MVGDDFRHRCIATGTTASEVLLATNELIESPVRSSHALRRALSERDLGQVASPEAKAKDLEGAETQSDRAELKARTAPLVKC